MKKILAGICAVLFVSTAVVSVNAGKEVYDQPDQNVLENEPEQGALENEPVEDGSANVPEQDISGDEDMPSEDESTDVMLLAAEAASVTVGDFTIEGGIENKDFKYTPGLGSPDIITILTNTEMTIYGTPTNRPITKYW